MANEKFKQWVEAVKITKAAELISEHEAKRGNAGVTYQSVQDWLRNGIPPKRVIAIEAVSGIHRSVLAPDIYPAEEPRAATA